MSKQSKQTITKNTKRVYTCNVIFFNNRQWQSCFIVISSCFAQKVLLYKSPEYENTSTRKQTKGNVAWTKQRVVAIIFQRHEIKAIILCRRLRLSKKVKAGSTIHIFRFSRLTKTQNDSAFSRLVNHNNVKLITQIEQTQFLTHFFVIFKLSKRLL